ncbi:NAD(+) synthase [Mesorhizobium sp. ESP6-5]|uniref:NAD(+) synthase n=1 Tax=unclassified Mesorhizobium TaxID=325217 RepID=UPI00112ED747|nr:MULTISPECIES: NAD(+) synthase [unclassified Mesorhizobium]MBZ9931826.1 NAD(+) synthase [Mesorhizobium sp. BR1-1-5]MBZ9682792.1 NAD(+) synthase [Mesorhizobium sp. CO1-1-2]MBZ9758816.1 NAD(+) synthase [Mesorhizobium sp. ESP6-5]MBZ9907988.1 NAD(+) synthase [Mesorhizobium sp. BR115XR7A]MBZ9927582.1 NAD(+) synthase [Mesorhizobium sp. BR1-1-4]
MTSRFGKDVLALDAAAEVDRIVASVREQVLVTLRRRGVVVGLSGGIDSSVVASLCVAAFGKDRVLGIFMPERDSSGDSLRLGRVIAGQLGIDTIAEDIAPALDAIGAYSRQIEAIRTVVPDYGEGWKCKLVLTSVLESKGLNITRLTVQDPQGKIDTVRLSGAAYLQIVAATNYKQRIRKMTEYYHADRLGYAVAGTPNRLEYDQGFFVKQGDGIADLMPIVHLYKTQVYQLAEYLGVDGEIRRRPPTTDTFSMAQSQEEFYFALPYHQTDLCLYGVNHGICADDVADVAGLSPDEVQKVFKDIEAKRRAARYLHAQPLPSVPMTVD